MCGLIGMTTNRLINSEIKRYHLMAAVSALRGEQSTGTIWVDKDHNWKVHKRLGHPLETVRTPQWVDMCNDVAIRAILGHTRFATKGAITLDNAHPFVVDGIVGMHNGTIHHGIPEKYKKDVDSHGLYEFISSEGLTKALSAVKYGAYALQWLQWHGESEDLKIHIIRNEDRPLHYVDTGGCRVWMSDKRHLEFVLSETNGHGKVETFKPYHLYTCTINSTGTPEWSEEDLSPEIKKAPSHSYYMGKSVTRFQGYDDPYEGYYSSWPEDGFKQSRNEGDDKGQLTKPSNTEGVVEKQKEVHKQIAHSNSVAVSDVAYVNTHGSVYVSPLRYKYLKKKGCCWCGENTAEKYEESFINSEDWMCSTCVQENGYAYAYELNRNKRNIVQPQQFTFKCVES